VTHNRSWRKKWVLRDAHGAKIQSGGITQKTKEGVETPLKRTEERKEQMEKHERLRAHFNCCLKKNSQKTSEPPGKGLHYGRGKIVIQDGKVTWNL